MLRFIVRSVPERREYVDYLRARIPGLVVVEDAERCARATRCAVPNLIRALDAASFDDAVHLEDDVILTNNFVRKVEDAVWERPDDVIQFFSMRAADLSVGSRYDTASKFMMTQCFRLPPGRSRELAAFARDWTPDSVRTGQDTMMREWMVAQRLRYWLHVPSLVDHRPCVSAIDPRRSRSRQSFTFSDADLDKEGK